MNEGGRRKGRNYGWRMKGVTKLAGGKEEWWI
jgi:hypothetical protein